MGNSEFVDVEISLHGGLHGTLRAEAELGERPKPPWYRRIKPILWAQRLVLGKSVWEIGKDALEWISGFLRDSPKESEVAGST